METLTNIAITVGYIVWGIGCIYGARFQYQQLIKGLEDQ